jgi:hypothetical protein
MKKKFLMQQDKPFINEAKVDLGRMCKFKITVRKG